ncbi:AAA family ATPase [Fusarium albosuccineum]|uniref:AAA family ATPase n=1 Tax=Fusarium albosuccineum TaxID=1237068 RepID=A0A8H4LLJ3_9HYPO|nr:AAA family ATPase [Fusarium albosuccineum]
MSEGPHEWLTEGGGLAPEHLSQHSEETTVVTEELQYDPELADKTTKSGEAYDNDNSSDWDVTSENFHDNDKDTDSGSEGNNKSIWNATNSRVKDRSVNDSASPGSEAIPDEQQNTLEPADTWAHLRHITISRDQTQAGVSDREKLAVLRQQAGVSDGEKSAALEQGTQAGVSNKEKLAVPQQMPGGPAAVAAQQMLTANGINPNTLHPQQLQNFINAPPAHQQKSIATHKATNAISQTKRHRVADLPTISTERLWDDRVGGIENERAAGGPILDENLRGSNGTDNYANRSAIFTMNANNELGKGQGGSNAARIADLEEEIQELRRLQSSLKSTTWHIFHKIAGDESSYLAEPSWTWDRDLQVKLKGNSPLANPDEYLRQRLDVAFVVYKHYEHDYQAKALKKAKAEGSVLPDPVPVKETIELLSDRMLSAVDAFTNTIRTFKDHFPDWQPKKPIESPFLFWYCYRSAGCLETMSEPHRSQMRLLTEWIDQNYNDTYTEAEEKFTRGRVSRSTMPFLVRPGEVLVSKNDEGVRGYIARSWAGEELSFQPSQLKDKPHKISTSWRVYVWCYEYDGRFYRDHSSRLIQLKLDEDAEDVEIAKLAFCPLRFETGEFRSKLEHRGRVMWACRRRKLIAYKDGARDGLSGEGERYMIDFNTYKQLHLDSPNLKNRYLYLNRVVPDEMDPAVMECEDPPQGHDLFAFPNRLVGYNLREKKWRDLKVDQIQDVSWNKQAFEHLVINHDTKDLIQALVTSKLESQESTDIIQGKGNGLIILLHGGPGTGKTFTAESVAEIAEKPLYRVTCGDIGTKPEEYLESVLHLGKIWGCVVLLDEADVFLEQRTLTDLERNALVSVFLRVLEYYEGILILTSNRVGTFDETFKSRIQLSLHYEALDKPQRRTIWSNFLNRLKTLETNNTKIQPIEQRKRKFEETKGIDFDDIERHVGDLAEHEMNGRQIRNAITTARQLAKFKGESMTYRHLTHVITTSMKFDRNAGVMSLHGGSLFGVKGYVAVVTGGSSGLGLMISRQEKYLDILVSNAGIRRDPPVRCNVLAASLPELQASMWSSRHSDWADTFCVNTTAHYFLSVSFLPLLEAASRVGRDEGRGVVIMTSSCASMHNATNIDLTSYATSKAATDHLVKLLAAKFSRFYVRVVGINPGFVPSNMNPVGEEGNLFSALFDQVPAKRAGNESDIAGTVLYLASRAGAYVDGISLCVDGGRVLLANGQE